jgi:hypothetical protein
MKNFKERLKLKKKKKKKKDKYSKLTLFKIEVFNYKNDERSVIIN